MANLTLLSDEQAQLINGGVATTSTSNGGSNGGNHTSNGNGSRGHGRRGRHGRGRGMTIYNFEHATINASGLGSIGMIIGGHANGNDNYAPV